MIKYLLISFFLVTPLYAQIMEAKDLEIQTWYTLEVKQTNCFRTSIMKISNGWIMSQWVFGRMDGSGSITFISDANHEIKWDIRK